MQDDPRLALARALPFAMEDVVEATFSGEFGLSGWSRLDVTLADARILTFEAGEAVRLARAILFEKTGTRLA